MNRTKSDVVIIGGVATGSKTAATLARRNPNLKIIVFEKSEHISFGTCGLPYFASGDINSFEDLTKTSYGVVRDTDFFKTSKGFDVITEAEVIAINRDDKSVRVRMINNGEEFIHGYEHLVIATGASPKKPPFAFPDHPKIKHFTRPDDAIKFREAAQAGQIGKVIIIGAGLIGCELAEAVGGMWGIETVLLEKEKQVLPYVLDPEMSDIVIRELKNNDIEIITDCRVTGIKINDNDNPVVEIENCEPIETDFVFLALGVKPNNALAEAADLKIGKIGGIDVDEFMKTSDKNIYAGGDCVELTNIITDTKIFIPMGSLANRHGRIIAENIAGNASKFPGTTGAFFVKVYDTNVGAVGISERVAQLNNLNYDYVIGSFVDKPDFYPESKSFTAKMIYEKKTGRLLGLQTAGAGDIFRRIDVFSLLLKNRATIEDMLNLEHGYAPPYSEALDPLHHLGAMAQAKINGFDISRIELDDDSIWLDVREIDEAKGTPLVFEEQLKKNNRLINIPLGELRDRIDQLDNTKPITIICRRGPRAYQAAVILKKAGFGKITIAGGGTQALQG
ncbi:MAG: FAD-dependent oxidoreductase [Candidatus Zixiibacteriota bacterium]